MSVVTKFVHMAVYIDINKYTAEILTSQKT